MRHRFVIPLLLSVMGLAGCHGPLGRGRVVPGKATLEEAVSTLREQVSEFELTQFLGTCKLGYRDDEGKWRRMPSINIKLYLEAPYNLFLMGSVVPGPEGKIFLGANKESFWLSIRPEINTYWYGRWDEMPDVSELELNPRVVIESMGIIRFEANETWHLESQKGVDVLTCTDTISARVTKRLFVNTKKYELTQIEYYDEYGDVAVSVDLERYRVLDGHNKVPTGIRVSRYAGKELEGRATFHLKEGTLKQFSETVRQRSFQPVTPRGYDRINHVTRFGSIRE